MPKLKYIQDIIVTFVLILLTVLVNACGGGGDGTNPEPVDDNVNGGLTGRIFTQDGWIIDIATGKGKRVPGIIWDSFCLDFDVIGDDFDCTDHDPTTYYGDHPNYNAFPNKSGDKYIVAINDCVDGYTLDCIELHDTQSGSLIGEQYTVYPSVDIAKLSYDGQFYAYTFVREAYNDSPTLLIINNINNEEITYSAMPDDGAVSFEWTKDNRLVYAYNGGIYVTSPYGTEGSRIFFIRDYPELSEYIGIGGSVRVSPDGKKIAFNLFKPHLTSSYTPQTPWIINIDGTDLHRLAHVDSEEELFGSMAWSPDGKYILIIEGYITSNESLEGAGDGSLYAIPSDSRNVKLNQDGNDGIIRLQTNYKNSLKYLTYIFNDAVFMWVP